MDHDHEGTIPERRQRSSGILDDPHPALAIRRHRVWVVRGEGSRPDLTLAVEGRAAAVRHIELPRSSSTCEGRDEDH